MYNPILPSSLLKQQDSNNFSYQNKILKNSSLRMGVVIETIEIDDKEKSINGIAPEYDVLVVDQEEDGPLSTTVYRNCLSAQFFGGVADFFEAKLRSPDKAKEIEKKVDFTNEDITGSVVLLLCLDSNAEKAIIIGSLGNPNRKTTLTKENEQHLEGEYNGVNWQINKDGEFTVTFKSKTNNKGEYDDETSGGTYLKMDKKGNFEINDDESELIQIDKENKAINIESENEISQATKEYSVEADNINLTAAQKLVADISGTAAIKVKGKMGIETGAILNIKAAMAKISSDSVVDIGGQVLKISAATTVFSCPSFTISGGTFIIQGGQMILGASPTPAVTLSTQFIGIGNKGAPVISSAIGPFSSSVMIST
jgi:hypothetical protein